MPEMDGFEVARQLRGAGLVLAAVTGRWTEADRRGAGAAGFDFYLLKPVPPVELVGWLACLRDDPEWAARRAVRTLWGRGDALARRAEETRVLVAQSRAAVAGAQRLLDTAASLAVYLPRDCPPAA
jgi:CheY-like chemotaxis protein